ncbi:protein lin-37 homolog [Anopheles bellator]|uniref:protein lin-37 homolog n=1 Tax=Anopheles bellator TaxID=139047 RepID=UPI0026470E7B|nr:protein lin-37 homolog [Anopheles bellator]
MLSKRRSLIHSDEKRKAVANVDLARGRLKGALKTVNPSSDETSEEHDDSDESPTTSVERGRTDAESAVHQPYIMRFFDRSIDLTQFNEKSTLYSMCRTWFQNNPKTVVSGKIDKPHTPAKVKREFNPDIVEQFQNGEVKEIYEMPLPESAGDMEPFHQQTALPATEFEVNGSVMEQDELLEEHLYKWKSLRKDWTSHRAEYNQRRYDASFKLIDALKVSQ